MELDAQLILLRRNLLKEVAYFCANNNRFWKMPVVDMLRELKEDDAHAVFFGGTLRSLLHARYFEQRPGRPRDVDIVTSCSTIEYIKRRFQSNFERETRFGGIKLRRKNWEFDVWPLSTTWSFIEDKMDHPSFHDLPSTTFLNLEAIAVDVWPKSGKSRTIYSGGDQFFHGIANRLVDINREGNPFPELQVIRSLLLAFDLNYRIGRRLASYIVEHGNRLGIREMDAIQCKHYGVVRRDGRELQKWVWYLANELERSEVTCIQLPYAKQMGLMI